MTSVNSNTVAVRDAKRQQLEGELARFLSQGGEVTQVATTARSVPGSLRFQLPGSVEGYPKKKKWRR